MNSVMRADLIRILEKDLGKEVTVEQMILHLEKVGAIWDSSVNRYVMGSEFYRILSEPGPVYAQDIEERLAERYSYSASIVKQARLQFHRKVADRKGSNRKRLKV